MNGEFHILIPLINFTQCTNIEIINVHANIFLNLKHTLGSNCESKPSVSITKHTLIILYVISPADVFLYINCFQVYIKSIQKPSYILQSIYIAILNLLRVKHHGKYYNSW